MPDISLCQNKNCPSHLKCYRYLATPSLRWQSYGLFAPNKNCKKCEYFVKYKKENINAD